MEFFGVITLCRAFEETYKKYIYEKVIIANLMLNGKKPARAGANYQRKTDR